MTADEAHAVLGDAFDRARDSAPEEFAEQDYVIGGARTRLRVVGRALERSLADAFSHLRVPPGCPAPPDVRVDVWDASASRVSRPRATRCRGDDRRTFDDGILTTGDNDRHMTFERGPTLTWLDRRARRVVAWRHSAHALPLIERAKPFAPLVSIWLGDCDLHAVHGALIAKSGRGALLVGGSGAGKTTCALLCLEGGFAYLGDDAVTVGPAPDGGFTGYSLYGSSRIHADHPARFAWLPLHAVPGRGPAETKALVFPRHLPAAELLGSAPLRAILLPRVTGLATSRVRRAGKAEVFRALVTSSLLTRVPPPSRRRAEVLAALAGRVPGHHFDLGRDLREIPHRVREALDTAPE